MSDMRGLAVRVETASNCTGCPYRDGPAVASRGKPASSIVIVGEAPGRDEVDRGQPFVGRAGKLLSGAFVDAGLREADLFITNSVACRPYRVRPTVRAIDACRPRLLDEVGLHHRAAIVALGATALRALTGRADLRVRETRGSVLPSEYGPVVASLHPAWVLRRPSERALLVGDLRKAKALDAEG